jgi:hypothetical protein
MGDGRGFQRPYVHLTPEAYQALAAQHGLRVIALQLKAEAWDFMTRAAFLVFCLTTCVEWTRLLPEDKLQAFITEVLDRYRTVAADIPQEENISKFNQLEVVLVPTEEAGMGDVSADLLHGFGHVMLQNFEREAP